MTRVNRPRLIISTRPGLRDHLQGAWWPASTDIVRELGPMLAEAAHQAPAVLGVSLNRSEWPDAPLHFQALSTRSPAVSWYGLNEPHLVVLRFTSHRKSCLLVVPPNAPDPVAAAAMLMASAPGNSLGTVATLAAAHAQVSAEHHTDQASA